MKVEAAAWTWLTWLSLASAACADRRAGFDGDASGAETSSGSTTLGRESATNEAVTADGSPPTCGDGVVDPDEACDDGNDVDGDGCNRDCVVSGSILWTTMLDDTPCLGALVVDSEGILYASHVDSMNDEVVSMFESSDGSLRNTISLPHGLWPAGSRFASGITLTGTPAATPDDRIVVQRRDADGDMTWEQSLEDPTEGSRSVTATAVGPDGSVTMVVGVSLDPDGRYDMIQLDEAGSIAWSVVIEETSYAPTRELRRAAAALDGDLVFASAERLDRYGGDGTLRWSQPMPSDVYVEQVAFAPDGSAYATLILRASGNPGVRGYDASGSLISDWIDEDDSGPSTDEHGSYLDVDSQGNVVVGHTVEFREEPLGPPRLWVWVSKYRPDGARMWGRTFEPPEGATKLDLCDIVVTPDDRIVVMSQLVYYDGVFLQALAP